MRQGPEGTVGGGVGVAADDGHARLGAALLGADHVDDAVTDVAHGEELDAVVGDVPLEGGELQARLFVGHGGHAQALALSGDIVVSHGQGPVRAPDLPPVGAQAGKGLRRRHLVDQVEVDIEDRLAVLFGDEVRIPDLVVKGLASHGAHLGG